MGCEEMQECQEMPFWVSHDKTPARSRRDL